jgi:transposase
MRESASGLNSGGRLPALSLRFRSRVASALSSSTFVRRAANRFGIGINTAIRWTQRGRYMLGPRAWGHNRCWHLSRRREAVLTLVAHQSDLTLEEIRDSLSEQYGITVGGDTVTLRQSGLGVSKAAAPK